MSSKYEINKNEEYINSKNSQLNEKVQGNNKINKEALEYYSNILNNESINKMNETIKHLKKWI